MNNKSNFMVFTFIFVVFSLLTSIGLFADTDKNEELKITGTVMAMSWDDEDNVNLVAISVTVMLEDSSEYSEDYIVLDNEKGKDLIKLVGETVKASGIVGIDEDGNKTILISEFEVIKEEE